MSREDVRGADPVEIGPADHILSRLRRRAEESPDHPILAFPEGADWREVSWKSLANQMKSVAAGFVGAGVGPGDRVALMSPTRMEWTVTDLGILSAGAVTVPLYHTSSAEQVRKILSDAGARMAVVADSELADRVREASDIEVLVLDDGGLDDLGDRGGAAEVDEAERRVDALTNDDVATIVYTSGTTGDPKGCVLTHRNLVWTVAQAGHGLQGVIQPGESLLQLLPLAYIFARLIQFVCLDSNMTVGFPSSPDDPREDVRSFKPTLFVGVPRAFEKVYEAARRQAEGGVKSALFRFSESAGQAWSKADRPGAAVRARRAVADRLVFGKLRDALGGRVRYCVSGGAPLSKDLTHFFRGAGVPILEGYGLTETTGPATVNTPDATRVGSVGRPLPGVEVRLDDGEILTRGGNVFQRYYHDEARTDEDFDGDWFRTGDVGEVDADGFVFVRDRKKEMIVTATGKIVAPAPLEDRVNSHPLVSQTMLVGDRRKFIAALVTLDENELATFAKEHNLGGDADAARLKDDGTVRAEVEKAVDAANQMVSRSESIRKFAIVDREFTEDAGELTPTLKLRRRDIADHFSDDIDALYS